MEIGKSEGMSPRDAICYRPAESGQPNMKENAPTQNMAVFCDFENIALGVRDENYAAFDIEKVLDRLLLKGNIVVKKAYCDWDRYKEFKPPMHEAAFELIEIPHIRQSGKNSADIRMVVDLCGCDGRAFPTFTPLSVRHRLGRL